MLPFSSEYKRETENHNQYAPNLTNAYSKSFSRMLLLTFSWNFDFGQTFKAASKKLNNTDTDSGIIKGDK